LEEKKQKNIHIQNMAHFSKKVNIATSANKLQKYATTVWQ